MNPADKKKRELKIIINTTKKNNILQNEIQDKFIQIKKLESDLNKIKSAKFFKLWQAFNKIKKIF